MFCVICGLFFIGRGEVYVVDVSVNPIGKVVGERWYCPWIEN